MIKVISGGIKSGKSRFALEQYEPESGLKRYFLATAEAYDEAMAIKINLHKEERKELDYHTIEEPLYLSTVFEKIPQGSGFVILDCLTVWVGNMFHHFDNDIEKIDSEIEKFLQAIKKTSVHLIIVTNETSLGIIPDNSLARQYSEKLGELNSNVVFIADQFYLMVSGLPLKIK